MNIKIWSLFKKYKTWKARNIVCPICKEKGLIYEYTESELAAYALKTQTKEQYYCSFCNSRFLVDDIESSQQKECSIEYFLQDDHEYLHEKSCIYKDRKGF